MRWFHSLTKIVVASAVLTVVLMYATSGSGKASSHRSVVGTVQYVYSQGQCLNGLMSRCPVCSGLSDEQCDTQASFASCNSLTEACAVTRVWSVRGQVEAVSKGCIPLDNCNSGSPRCTTIATTDHKQQRVCITCNSEQTCNRLDFRVRVISFSAGSLLTVAIVLYIVHAKRRRNCPETCVALCGGERKNSTDSTSSTSPPKQPPSRWPRRLATSYRYSVLP